MTDRDFDQLLKDYRQAIDAWVKAIHAEEALANDDHSMVEMEKWDAAGFSAHDAEAVAKKARDRYKNALRKKNYGRSSARSLKNMPGKSGMQAPSWRRSTASQRPQS